MASSCSFGSQLLPRSLSHRTPAAATYAPSSLGIARFRLQIYPRLRPLPACSSCFERWQRSRVIARAEEEARDSSHPQRGRAACGSDGIGEYKELMDRSGVCDPLCSVDEVSSQDFKANYQPMTDLLKALTILISALAGATAINHSWVAENQAPSTNIAVTELTRASAEVGEIVFFLLGAMTIVEIIDAHQGFKLVTDNITTRKPRVLLWVVGFVTFFLSSVLDNLTSTIVMVSLLRKLVPPSEYRSEVNGATGQSSTVLASEKMAPRGQLVFAVGFGALLFVPVFKAITGLPPYMGILFGLGVLWILTDAIHYGDEERQKLKVPQALSRIDTQGVLFFLGILLSVSSLEAAGILRELANYLDAHIPNAQLIASAIGVVSAIIDNVPLVAATMGMYDLTSFPQDADFWQLIAFCAGTGGSMLIIGSAAGVAFMGMEKADFFWYLRKVSGFAFAGYAAGIAAYLAGQNLHFSLPTSLAEIPLLSGS
ncbi:hypothetical protein KFK09_017557 [Dendrobium nobile]|uniref:Citrate transporter-like domain-containing protein n=1 Tax=Dendrobium nobile TaxID=94219 RepID=A0A8T3B1K7_DENNO|nr:hypothetical protein KFK09_017557 [Dendrobium nobile]